jgi:hypothetical protein
VTTLPDQDVGKWLAEEPVVSVDGLRALREEVYRDPGLALRLRRAEPGAFAVDVLRLASETGLDVDEADIAAEIVSARRAWALRWIQ